MPRNLGSMLGIPALALATALTGLERDDVVVAQATTALIRGLGKTS